MNRRKKIYLGFLGLSAAALLVAGLRGSLPGLGGPTADQAASAVPDTGHDGGKSAARPADAKLDRKAIDEAAERWYQELLAKHPQFRIEFRTVPDEQNGYLQWMKFLQKLEPGQGLPDFKELREALSSGDDVDIALIEKWIAAHPDLLAELQRIAALPDRSAKGMEAGMIAQAFSGDCGLLLVAHSRLMAAQGDPAAALRSYAAALNLARHADGVEGPSLLHAVSAASMRSRVMSELYKYALPQIAADPALLAESSKLLASAKLGAEARQIAIGEWNYTTRIFILPALLGDPETRRQVKVANPQAFLDAYSAGVKEMVAYYGTPAFQGTAATPQAAALELLTGPDREVLQMVLGDFLCKTMEGLRLQQSDIAHHQAALAILSGQEPPLEPLTGQPFLWDPVKRELACPAELTALIPSLEAIKLP